MHFSVKIIISALTFFSTTSAKVIGFRAPTTIAAGEQFTVSILQDGNVNDVMDVAVAWGISPNHLPSNYVGNLIGSHYLGPEMPYDQKAWDFVVTTDANSTPEPKGNYTIFATIFSVVVEKGGITVLRTWQLDVVVGDATGSNTVVTTSET